MDAISNVLSYQILSQVGTIDFTNVSIGVVRPDTFFYFAKLRTLKLRPLDWPSFLDANWDVAWMRGLNFNVSIDLTKPGDFQSKNQLSLYLGNSDDTYDYPEEDFCYFAFYPHEQSILPIMNYAHRGECTCTAISILRYAMNYNQTHTHEYYSSTGHKHCLKSNSNKTVTNQIISNCKIDEKIEWCRTSRPTKSPVTSSTRSLEFLDTTSGNKNSCSQLVLIQALSYLALMFYVILVFLW